MQLRARAAAHGEITIPRLVIESASAPRDSTPMYDRRELLTEVVRAASAAGWGGNQPEPGGAGGERDGGGAGAAVGGGVGVVASGDGSG